MNSDVMIHIQTHVDIFIQEVDINIDKMEIKHL